MNAANTNVERIHRFWFFWLPLIIAVTIFLTLIVWVRGSLAQGTVQPTYASSEQACQALYEAVQSDNESAILQILGGGKELASSGDELEDKAERKQFAAKYQEMRRLVRRADGSRVLYIGAENWPFPVPLVSEKGRWRFDAEAGRDEVFFRRIGENEAVAIQVCHGLVRATADGGSETPSYDAAIRYAQTLAKAQTADARNTPGSPQATSAPFHGYYFRRVSNGTDNTVVALVAYPTEYPASGVMTFVVTSDDVVFEKDLGPKTAKLARAIGKAAPDLSWQLAE